MAWTVLSTAILDSGCSPPAPLPGCAAALTASHVAAAHSSSLMLLLLSHNSDGFLAATETPAGQLQEPLQLQEKKRRQRLNDADADDDETVQDWPKKIATYIPNH